MSNQEGVYKGKEVQLVIFELEDETYAIEIHKVREIIKMVDITPIPRAPSFIRGIINLRGKIVIVTDLKERFNLEKERLGTHIVIVEADDNTFGVIVDDVSRVLRIPEEEIKEAPSIITEKIHADYIKGVVVLDDKLVILLEPSKIYSEAELVEMGSAEKAEKEKAEKEAKEKAEKEKAEKEAKEKAEKEAKEKAEKEKAEKAPKEKKKSKKK